ncbi:MAG: hypothetical protein NZ936_13840, partial [Alphaproteobacteria bacterium]|nr:hypothetical protein [Alphaproteobacteria bacterium]
MTRSAMPQSIRPGSVTTRGRWHPRALVSRGSFLMAPAPKKTGLEKVNWEIIRSSYCVGLSKRLSRPRTPTRQG